MITEKEVLCVEIAGLCHDLGELTSSACLKNEKHDKSILEVSHLYTCIISIFFQAMVRSPICLISDSIERPER